MKRLINRMRKNDIPKKRGVRRRERPKEEVRVR